MTLNSLRMVIQINGAETSPILKRPDSVSLHFKSIMWFCHKFKFFAA